MKQPSHPQRIEPPPGGESVWDYPRPPKIEDDTREIVVTFNGVTIAKTRRVKRVLETSHPPVYYLPPEDILAEVLVPSKRASFCEWKGNARYFYVQVGDTVTEDAAWSYPQPTPSFLSIRDYVAFFAHLMEACFVDGERVQPQPGNFYGGWITRNVTGPFKGEPGTWNW